MTEYWHDIDKKYEITIEFVNDRNLRLGDIKGFVEFEDRLEFECPQTIEKGVICWHHYVVLKDKIVFYYFKENNKTYNENNENYSNKGDN